MQHNKILYSILCGMLCASVAFAAQEPLTPEVTQDNMLVTPAGDTKANKAISQNSAGNTEVNTKVQQPVLVYQAGDEVPKQPAEQAEAPKRTTTHKPTLAPAPADGPDKKGSPTPVPASVPVSGPVSGPASADAASRTANPVTAEKGLVVPVTLPVPSLGNLTFLRGKLEESKLKVAIAEQDARLRQMTMPSQPSAPVMQAMPQIPLDMLLDSQKAKASKSATFSSAPAKRSQGVVSIQGVNGILSATIATGKGSVTVKQGDSFGGGKIESITYNQVMVRSGKKTAPIPFVE